jgi:hypothetical protein
MGFNGWATRNLRSTSRQRKTRGRWTKKFKVYSSVEIDTVNKSMESTSRLPSPRLGQPRWPNSSFTGIMIDPGTNVSMHGRAQHLAYEAHVFRKMPDYPAVGKVSSMAGSSTVLRKVNLSIPIGDTFGSFISTENYGDAPILLGSFDMARQGLNLDTSTRTVRGDGIRIPLSFNRGH